jgi:hypothetical protein
MSHYGQKGLGLVAQTLFMAILFHALFALMLVDFRFTAFLDGTHVCISLLLGEGD